uniref:LNR domain-containing protein n=1 Tax=Chromera velia CCMP2878 TaxID=1169474 RepID=A0A0G4HVH5_9ALVE|eukprot:Cvel_8866.t1-p1 / transcript=Cvel_8866.t1 / gene=Cvel_8866 / organism=Chromera_velia_CCMP2878 / gene_product=hypothetical protein / transcript_product=hypothetical protein / location=Cvel_scaffold498:57952-68120(+) / protein_length=2104 / sequence_SO=supercontig / SO=protein_coding / is_pseudo=false
MRRCLAGAGCLLAALSTAGVLADGGPVDLTVSALSHLDLIGRKVVHNPVESGRQLQDVPVTFIGGVEYRCEDVPDVKEQTGQTCPELKSLLPGGCSFVLATAGVELPDELPEDSTLVVICPDTCGACEERCNTGCPLWFQGNGFCDEACNTAGCNFDNNDCEEDEEEDSGGAQEEEDPGAFEAPAPDASNTVLYTDDPNFNRTPPPPPTTTTTPRPTTPASCPAGFTGVGASCYRCADIPAVREFAGQDCRTIVDLVGCDYVLSTVGAQLPPEVPPGARVHHVCPSSCGRCEQTCAVGCPDWFLGNGFCDAGCNVEKCNWDAGDCAGVVPGSPTVAPPSSGGGGGGGSGVECPFGQTFAAGECRRCSDQADVEAASGQSCANLKNLVGCDFKLAAAGMSLPDGVPADASLAAVCPSSCDLCSESCNRGCAEWFRGNGHCDEACNVPACGFDGGDCAGQSSPTSAPATTTTTKPRVAGDGSSVNTEISKPSISFCMDNEQVQEQGFTCPALKQISESQLPAQGCAATLGELAAKTQQPVDAEFKDVKIEDACPKTCRKCDDEGGRFIGCEDNQLVQSFGFSCPVLMGVAPLSCDSKLEDISEDDLPAIIPEGTRIRDICFDTCGLCQAPTCFDGFKNGDEEWIDCGGSCRPCRSCTASSLKRIDRNKFEVEGHENGLLHTASRTVTCASGYVPGDPIDDALKKVEEERIFCLDGEFNLPGLLTCQESPLDVFEGGFSVSSSKIGNWDSTSLPALQIALTDALGVVRPEELRVKEVTLPVVKIATGGGGGGGGGGPVCEDNPLIRQAGYSCGDILVFGLSICELPLLTVAQTQGAALPSGIPDGTLVKEACMATCGQCRRLEEEMPVMQGASLRGMQAQASAAASGEPTLSLTYWISKANRPTFDVPRSASATFVSYLRSALSSTDLSFPDLNDPSRKVSATEAFTSDDAITRDRIEFTSVRERTVGRSEWNAAYSEEDRLSGDWTLAANVTALREFFSLPEIEEPEECRGRSPRRTDCCGMAAEVRSLLSGECGRWIYGGLMQPNYINAFCSRTDVAGSVGGRSCNAQLQATISTYDGKPGAGCPMTARVRALSEGICQQRGGSYCLLDLQSNLGEFRQGIDGLVEKSAAELDGICAIDSCWRSNVRYVEAVAVLSNRRAGYTSPVDGYFLRGGHLKEWSEALIDAACVQEGGRYCQDIFRDIVKAEPLKEGLQGRSCPSAQISAPLGRLRCSAVPRSTGANFGNSPYHVVAGTLLKAHGRYGCVRERGGHQSAEPRRFCGDLLFPPDSGSENAQRRLPAPAPDLPRCPDSCPRWYLADGECDPACFSEECNWDAGDCKASAMYPKFFSKVDSLVKRSCTPQWNAPERYECSTECFNQFNNALYNHGCCVAGALETMEELESSVRRLEGSSRNDDLIDWSIALVERTCKISMDRTCSDGDSRNLLKIVMGIDNLNADRLGDQQEAGVRAEVARAVADRLGVMPHDVARSSPVSVDGGTKVVVDVDTGNQVVNFLARQSVRRLQSASPSENMQVTARAVQRRLDDRPDLTAETYRFIPEEPISTFASDTVTRSVSSGTVNAADPTLANPFADTFGLGVYALQVQEESCDSNYGIDQSIYTVSGSGFSEGNTRTFSCNPNQGYVTTSSLQAGTLTCGSGVWLRSGDVTCEMACRTDQIPESNNDRVQWRDLGGNSLPGEYRAPGHVVEFTCSDGYSTPVGASDDAGKQNSECRDQNWSGVNLNCEATCGAFDKWPPGDRDMYQVESSPTGTNVDQGGMKSGVEVSFVCKNGFSITGPSMPAKVTSLCSGGSWSGFVAGWGCVEGEGVDVSETTSSFADFFVRMFVALGAGGWAGLLSGLFVLGLGAYLYWHFVIRRKAEEAKREREAKMAEGHGDSTTVVNQVRNGHTMQAPPLGTGAPVSPTVTHTGTYTAYDSEGYTETHGSQTYFSDETGARSSQHNPHPSGPGEESVGPDTYASPRRRPGAGARDDHSNRQGGGNGGFNNTGGSSGGQGMPQPGGSRFSRWFGRSNGDGGAGAGVTDGSGRANLAPPRPHPDGRAFRQEEFDTASQVTMSTAVMSAMMKHKSVSEAVYDANQANQAGDGDTST